MTLRILRTATLMVATLTAVPALAQTAVVPVDGTVKPAVIVADWPSLKPDQMANNEAIAQVLIAQGFSDVKILREGSLMTVTAQRDGQPIELIYSLLEGALISVNGETVQTESQKEAFGREMQGDKAPEAAGMSGDDAAPGADAGDDAATGDNATEPDGDADASGGASPESEGEAESESEGESEGTEGGGNG